MSRAQRLRHRARRGTIHPRRWQNLAPRRALVIMYPIQVRQSRQNVLPELSLTRPALRNVRMLPPVILLPPQEHPVRLHALPRSTSLWEGNPPVC